MQKNKAPMGRKIASSKQSFQKKKDSILSKKIVLDDITNSLVNVPQHVPVHEPQKIPTIPSTVPIISTNLPIIVPPINESVDRGGKTVGVGVNGDARERCADMDEDTSHDRDLNGTSGIVDLGSDTMQSEFLVFFSTIFFMYINRICWNVRGLTSKLTKYS